MLLSRSLFLRRSAFLAIAAALIGGCTDFSTPPESLGRLFVTAKDETGAGVGGINFTLLLNDRSTQWAKLTTSANGTGEFRSADGGVLPQLYVVRFDDINGNYKIATGETNDKTINVVAGQEFTVNFNITKKVPTGP
jgi:hypothetical protein